MSGTILATAWNDSGHRSSHSCLAAHGPFISSTTLVGEYGPLPVGSAMNYLVKDR